MKRCPSCSGIMNEVSKYELAPYGGWICPKCGRKVCKLK